MLSIPRLTGFLALCSATVSAMGMIPALPNALGKRDVQCGGGVFCPDHFYCVTGDNGEPGCCPDGKICSGPGGVKTLITTTILTIDTTHVTTHFITTTGINTETEVTTIEETTTEKPVYTTTYTTYTTDITITPSVVTDYFTTYTTYTTESVPTTPCSSSSYTVKSNVTATYKPHVNISATATPPPSEGGAAGTVMNAGLAGVVLAVLAVMMV